MDSLPTSARRAAAPEPRGQGAVRPVFGAKQAALQVGFRAGLLRLMQLARRREAVILTFHRFAGEGTGDPSGLPVAKFAAYMEYLARCRRVVSLPDDADPARIDASCRDGLLHVSVARREASKPRQIAVS